MGARRDVKYSVYDHDNLLVGNFKTKRNADKAYCRKSSKMLVSVELSDHTFSGYKIKKVLRRKK